MTDLAALADSLVACPSCGHACRVVGTQYEPVHILADTPSVEPAGLDAAWNEAEAALPDGWAIGMVWGTVTSERWGAMAGPWPSKQGESHEFGGGDTPAAALRQLASRLAERNPRTGELTLDQLRARSKDVSPLLPTQASDSPEKP